MNYFSFPTAAERYSKGRPHYHHHSIKHIKDFLQLHIKLSKALDIACGTGLSTQPLLEIAQEVYGTDSAPAMLDFALQKDKIRYQIAQAEQQPLKKILSI